LVALALLTCEEENLKKISLSFAKSCQNFIQILQTAFARIFLWQKITKPNCNWRKAEQNSSVQKRLE